MVEITALITSVRAILLEIAKHAAALGTGLQNVAPGDKIGTPNKSVQYLLGISEELSSLAKECEKLVPASSSHTARK